MRRDCKTVQIHWTAPVALGALLWLHPNASSAVIAASVFLHEAAHCAMFKIMHIEVRGIVVHMFGIKIRARGQGIFPPRQMIPIALSGPMMNLVLGMVACHCGWKNWVAPNMVLACINVLPAFPLDGGQIAYSVLAIHAGRKRAKHILRRCGYWLGTMFLFLGGYALFVTKFNFTFLLFGGFLLYAAKKEGINPVLESKSLYGGSMQRASVYLIDEHTTIAEAAANLPAEAIGAVIDNAGAVVGMVTAYGLYHEMERAGADLCVKDCIQ